MKSLGLVAPDKTRTHLGQDEITGMHSNAHRPKTKNPHKLLRGGLDCWRSGRDSNSSRPGRDDRHVFKSSPAKNKKTPSNYFEGAWIVGGPDETRTRLGQAEMTGMLSKAHQPKTKKPLQITSRGFGLLAVRTRLELATPCVTGMYSNQLNYRTRFLRTSFSQTRVQI